MTLHFGSWDDVLRTMYAGIDTSDGGWGLGEQKYSLCFVLLFPCVTQNFVPDDDNLKLFFFT